MTKAEKRDDLRERVELLNERLVQIREIVDGLRKDYGLEVVNASVNGIKLIRVHLMCGIAEVAELMGCELTEENGAMPHRHMRLGNAIWMQLADRYSKYYKPLNYKGEAVWDMEDEDGRQQ